MKLSVGSSIVGPSAFLLKSTSPDVVHVFMLSSESIVLVVKARIV